MATVRRETVIDVSPEQAWDALSDWGAVHERLVPGFVTHARLDGRDRIVTFFNGTTVRERFVDCDDESMRLVWSVADGPYEHHNASAQLFAEGEGRTRFVWTADFLPNELAIHIAGLMTQGTNLVKKTLELEPARVD
jgi:hypothetical protein